MHRTQPFEAAPCPCIQHCSILNCKGHALEELTVIAWLAFTRHHADIVPLVTVRTEPLKAQWRLLGSAI